MQNKLSAHFAVIAFVSALAVGESTNAKSIGINIGNRGSNFSSGLGAAEVAGAVPAANWNDLTIPFGGDLFAKPTAAVGTVKDNTGAIVPGVSVAFKGDPNPPNITIQDTYNFASDGDPVHTANMKLMGSFLKGPDDATLGLRIELNSVPYATYDLYVYVDGFGKSVTQWDLSANGGGIFDTVYSVDASPGNFAVSNFVLSGYIASDFATAQAEKNNPTGNHNYMKISGLTASTLLLEGLTIGGGTGQGEEAISGIQIVDAAALDGDYDLDRDVDGADFMVWQKTLGSTTNLAADGNHSLQIDAGDLAVWKGNFGQTGALPAVMSVPEPSTGGLTLLAIIMLGRWRPRRPDAPTMFKGARYREPVSFTPSTYR